MAIGTSIPAAKYAVPAFPVRPFSVDEYHRLGEVGVLTQEDRVELLEGLITPMMTRGPRHDCCIGLIQQALFLLIRGPWLFRGQLAVTTSDSEPEPDSAVVRGVPRDYADHHPLPEETALVVEVSDSSLSRDHEKARIYARAAIPVYWIVNLVDNRIEVFSEPDQDAAKNKQVVNYEKGSTVPLVIDGATIAELSVDELLP